jgi:hypothetical protein
MSGDRVIELKRALEALRNGVPNRDAVRVVGCSQPAVEERFRTGLAALREDRSVKGLLVSGGFGTGKSHLLEYLEDIAVTQGFVCSRVVISKETPIYDPGKVYSAAIDSANVPGVNGRAMQEIALRLKPESDAYGAFERWAMSESSGIGALFPATLMLYERLKNDPEYMEDIVNFWSGEKLAVSRVRQGLKQVGAQSFFAIKAIPVAQLARQRFRFASRLIRAAGYAGWVLLLDEAELIGRYSLLQRGKSYAELARWLGRVDEEGPEGIVCTAAITDDFALAVLQEKGDKDRVGPRLRAKGTAEFELLAARAEAGMRLVERDALALKPPSPDTRERVYGQLKRIHGEAYDWRPPDLPSAETPETRPMRSYVRRWINEWDLRRLYPDHRPEVEEEDVKPGYGEDQAFEAAPEAD